MASAQTPSSIIARFAALLDAAGVAYMLTGSFASGIHGQPRASHDIDFVIAPTLGSLDKLLTLLPEDQFYVSREAALDAYGRESLFNVVDMTSGWKLDFICRKSRPFSLAEFDRRQLQEIEGAPVFVASAEDALLSKLEWAKLTKSERQLEDAAGILAIQGDDLDTAYVDRWAAALGLQVQWQEARGLAGRPSD
jgi:hypothetical protein